MVAVRARRLIVFTIVLILLIGVTIGLYYYLRPRKEKGVIVLFGNVDVRQVDMGFRVSSRVIEMPFEEGDEVKPGDLVSRVDPQPYFDQVAQAKANLDSVRQTLIYAEEVYQRRHKLFGLKDGSISREDYEQSLSNRNAQVANLAAAEAALEAAEVNLRETEIFAPTEGWILTRVREPGTVVNVGEPVYTLSVASPVWIRAFISEPDLGLVYPGMPAEVYTDTKGGPVYRATVGFISPVAEFTPKTVETTQLRTDLVYRLRIYADNPDRALRQGMPVTVKLRTKQTASKERSEK